MNQSVASTSNANQKDKDAKSELKSRESEQDSPVPSEQHPDLTLPILVLSLHSDAEHKPVLDFTSLPPDELEAYISYYDLARAYPPPLSTTPPRRTRRNQRSSRSASPSKNDPSSSRRPLPRRRGRTPDSVNGELGGRKRTAAAVEMEERALAEQREIERGEYTRTNGLDVDRAGEFVCPTHFGDEESANHYLGNVASRHFQNQPAPKEGEAVVGFLYRCQTRGKYDFENLYKELPVA